RGRHPQAADRGLPSRRRLARGVRAGRGHARDRGPPLARVRHRGQPMTRIEAESAREGNKIGKFLRLVMIEHSVFALPFAYIAALSAMWTQTRSVHWVQLLLITIAMVSARTVAMSANRILDRKFDALNPRTAGRELVTGEMTVRTASVGTGIALVIFLSTAAALSWLCLA